MFSDPSGKSRREEGPMSGSDVVLVTVVVLVGLQVKFVRQQVMRLVGRVKKVNVGIVSMEFEKETGSDAEGRTAE
jgi:hypothetical protein